VFFHPAMGDAFGFSGLANEKDPVTDTKGRATSFAASLIARL